MSPEVSVRSMELNILELGKLILATNPAQDLSAYSMKRAEKAKKKYFVTIQAGEKNGA